MHVWRTKCRHLASERRPPSWESIVSGITSHISRSIGTKPTAVPLVVKPKPPDSVENTSAVPEALISVKKALS